MTTEPAAAPPADLINLVKNTVPYDSLWTSSAFNTAVALLADLMAAGQRHGVAAVDWFDGRDHHLAQAVTAGLIEAYARASQAVHLDNPLALLRTAAAAQELRVVESEEGEDSACVVLARQPETPAWGPDGNLPLVVALTREDSAWWMNGPAAWTWHIRAYLAPGVTVPAHTTPCAYVVAPPPSVEVAAEVFGFAAQVLAGTLTINP
ncbi:hypothetical protein [Nonomuraea fuscirosea]|uniref:hypothetical protein n=1 Tax=Nonomuraea fuscirosea TaxID=1291556 RepID=UPI0033E8E5F0